MREKNGQKFLKKKQKNKETVYFSFCEHKNWIPSDHINMDSTKKTVKIKRFDELFEYIGGIGVYQIAHIFILCKFVSFVILFHCFWKIFLHVSLCFCQWEVMLQVCHHSWTQIQSTSTSSVMRCHTGAQFQNSRTYLLVSRSVSVVELSGFNGAAPFDGTSRRTVVWN